MTSEWGSDEHKEKIKQDFEDSILSITETPPLKGSLWDTVKEKIKLGELHMPEDKKHDTKVHEAIAEFEDGLVKPDDAGSFKVTVPPLKAPLHYKKSINYDVWEAAYPSGTTCSELYAIDTLHKIEGSLFKVVTVDTNIVNQCYEIAFIEQIDYKPSITTLEDGTIKIDPIVDFLEEPGHFGTAGDWIPDKVPLPVRTERDKLFHELTNGVLS